MEHQPDAETEIQSKVAEIPNGHAVNLQSRDFGDKRYFPNLSDLEEMRLEWSLLAREPERTPRSIEEINRVIGRLVFEIDRRSREIGGEITSLESLFEAETYGDELHPDGFDIGSQTA